MMAEPRFKPDSFVLDPARNCPHAALGVWSRVPEAAVGAKGLAAEASRDRGGLAWTTHRGRRARGARPGLLGGRQGQKWQLPLAEKPNTVLDGGEGWDDAPAFPKRPCPPQPMPSKFNMSSVDKYRVGES